MALLLSVHEIVDHSRSRHDTAGVDYHGLVRTAQQIKEDSEEDISDEQRSRSRFVDDAAMNTEEALDEGKPNEARRNGQSRPGRGLLW